MAFEFVGASTGTTTAILEFEFTGGDSSYGNYRPLWLTIDGTSYSSKRYDSDNKGGGDSYWTISVSGLEPNTRYDVTAQLGYYTGTTPTKLNLYAEGYFITDEEASTVYVYSSGWKSAVPYIWTGGKWVEVSSSVYSGGWS